ncbi:MAG: chromate efflux transporter [Thermodesulfobacteriota bacterium]
MRPALRQLWLAFLRLGLTAFGGPAMVASIRDLAVQRHAWLGEALFQEGIALCQAIPGATAMQMAAYVGLRARGLPGALLAFLGFGLPAFVLMLALSVLYAEHHDVPRIVSAFAGLQVVVVALVAHAAWSFGRNLLKTFRDAVTATASAALLGAGASPFVVLAAAALSGLVLFKNLRSARSPGPPEASARRTAAPVLLLAGALLVGLGGLAAYDRRLFAMATLMLKIDFFAYGGGFASLPLMLHEVVVIREWLDAKVFMDGIALGQLTPGPIVITSTFVGYMVAGLAGALVATIAIFTPSFVVLVAAVPFFDRLKASTWLLRATRGMLASFVGLLFFVTAQFAAAVPWDMARVLLFAAGLAGLLRKADPLPVVLAGAAVSVLLF